MEKGRENWQNSSSFKTENRQKSAQIGNLKFKSDADKLGTIFSDLPHIADVY